MKVLIIPGHDDGDCGAVGNGYEDITYLNRTGDTENLEKICSLAEEGKYLEVKRVVEELKETK